MSTTEFVSYAQNAEDVVLWRALRQIRRGTYVDVGAADPTADSVTRAFYERGWRGVNVEPEPSLAAALAAERPADRTFAVAAGSFSGMATLYVSDQVGRSTLVDEIAGGTDRAVSFAETEVVVRTLDDILTEAGLEEQPIHFCKIDVEGGESDVLAGFDLSRWRPWVLVVEATEPQSTVSSHERWEQSVLSASYRFCLFDGLNRFYVAEEHADLHESLSFPACVFDQPYVRADVAAELDRLGVAAVEANRARSEADRTRHLAEVARDDADAARARTEADAARLVQRIAATEREVATAEALVAATRRDAVTWQAEALRRIHENAQLRQYAQALQFDRDAHAQHAGSLQANLGALERTVSWRITRPLRAVRKAQLRARSAAPSVTPAGFRHREDSGDSEIEIGGAAMLARRLAQTAALLNGDDEPGDLSLDLALARFEAAVERSTEPAEVTAWLGLVAAAGAYPTEREMLRGARLLRADGAAGLLAEMRRRFEQAVAAGDTLDRDLDIVRGATVVDVSHTAAHDLHTGIQRVVRETVGRWIDDEDLVLVRFDFSHSFAVALARSEADRFKRWRDHLHTSAPDAIQRVPKDRSGAVVVPWHSRVLLPELVADPGRCEAYRALAMSGLLSGLSLIGFDFIPMTATETVTDAMSANFATYLSVVKYADRISAISESTARDFSAFGDMLASQGLTAAHVAAHALPAEAPEFVAADVAAIRQRLSLGSLQLVLVVGSHEPRKNHLAVLESAQRLWRDGLQFQLLMIGGSGWRAEEFDEFVHVLHAGGYPVTVWKRASERDLWAAYHLAAFTVFPSLLEGYGLPVAESLVCGTPVITSDFGSMAEIATEHGGVMTVDPRNVNALRSAMHTLLTDPVVLDRLATEASSRKWVTWDDYAAAVWDHLTGE
jgi:FkbM family methyltransferase